MENTHDIIEKALRIYGGPEAVVARTDADSLLSPFLKSSFDLYRISFLGKSRLIAAPTNDNDEFPAVRKRLQALAEATGEHVALFAASLTASQKRVLLSSRTGFLCADGSIYLPELGLSIQDFATPRKGLPRRFSPSEQLCFLYCLYSSGERILQADACATTKLSAGSVSRAFSMFSDAGLLEYAVGGETGRLRMYSIPDKKAFYERGIAAYADPVREIMFLDVLPKGMTLPESGLSALARHSDLNPPARTVLAASPQQRASLNPAGEEPASGWSYEIQVLRYDPAVFAEDGCVDPVTMLRTVSAGDGDERVRMAIRQAMEGHRWYEG